MLMIIQKVPKGIVSDKKLCIEIDRLCQRYSFDTMEYGGTLVGAWKFKEVMPREFFGTPKLYPFENIVIYGPECSAQYLERQYGDWRKIPPLDKQVSHHDYYLNLSLPYAEYIQK